MRAEEGEECSAGEGVDDEERARGRAAVVQWSCAVAAFEFFECIGERASVSKVLGAAFVGVVFAASADGELEEECDEGRDDGEEDQFKDIAAVFVAAAESAEDRKPSCHAGDVTDDAGGGGGGGRDKDVAVFDVSDFMREDSFEFALAGQVHDSLCAGDDGVFGVAAGGKGVWSVCRDDVDARFWYVCALADVVDQAVELWVVVRACGFCAVHCKDDLVAEEVRAKIYEDAECERKRKSCLASKGLPDPE